MIDEIGNRYGSLVVLKRTQPPRKTTSKEAWFLCQCDCGNTTTVRGHCLRNGETLSCGCRRAKSVTGHGGRFVDKTGRRYGKLTVIKVMSIDERGYIEWLCRCDCGRTQTVSSQNLRKIGGTKSCGCLATLPEGEASFNAIYRRYIANAKSRGYEWNLTREQFRKIINQNCYYCDDSPSNVERAKRVNGAYIYNGIDRINNDFGYTIDNVVPCCARCNHIKRNYGVQEVVEWVTKIYNHFVLGKNSTNQ